LFFALFENTFHDFLALTRNSRIEQNNVSGVYK
jgi:hypothetical protein